METSVRISGILTQKEQKSDKYLYQIKQTYLETDQTPVFLGNILLYTTKDNCSIGTILTAEGELDVFLPARNEGNFDFAAYYQQMNITCRFYAGYCYRTKAFAFFNTGSSVSVTTKNYANIYYRVK